MKLGYLMLCHTALHRAAQVARHWAEAGCPVIVHVDARVKAQAFEKLKSDLADLPHIRFSKRHPCEWGTWGLVQATIDAAEMMIRDFPEVGHIYLASGSCLPLRPVRELADFLAERPRTDFIESVTTSDVGWTVGGLNHERFTLRFPFAWRKQRILFDAYVRLQRRLGMRRKMPEGLAPHLGSQWWCLSRTTLTAILQDPKRAENDRFFRKSWIPDESYFQTLVRRHSTTVESRSLTLSKFDFQGKPHIFYDDHLQLLHRSDCFMARKIWPQAGRLYREFLQKAESQSPRAEPRPGKIDRLFSKATERRIYGRPGLYMQSRFPHEGWVNGKTAAAYSVFSGFSEMFEDFEPWLARALGGRVHGHLYAPDRVHFAGDAKVYNGCLTDSAALRDYDPKLFLTNLIWNTRGERQIFQFSPRDTQDPLPFMAMDSNAQISVITGAWAIGVFRSKGEFSDLRREAARLQKIEAEALQLLRSPYVKARVRIWSLAEALETPLEPLADVLPEISSEALRHLHNPPQVVDLTGFGRFIQDLRNQGMQPTLVGDIPLQDAPPTRQVY